MTAALLDLRNLSVDIETPRGRAGILRGLDLSLAPGERLGIVGESGSGKSMLALAIMGLLPETAQVRGELKVLGDDVVTAGEDRLCALRGRRMAIIFQEPMTALNPVQPIGDQVAEGLRLHLRLGRRRALDQAISLLRRVGLPPERCSPRLYPHQLSGGQRQRVMIAMALACEPALLIADEPTTALDVTIQRSILDLIVSLAEERQMGLIMISHDLGVIARTTGRMAVMYAGRFVEVGGTERLLSSMAHPYTLGLHRAMPLHAIGSDRTARGQLARKRPRLPTIPGTVPDALSRIDGCSFANRCRHVEADCRTSVPHLEVVGPAHLVACRHPQGHNREREGVH